MWLNSGAAVVVLAVGGHGIAIETFFLARLLSDLDFPMHTQEGRYILERTDT